VLHYKLIPIFEDAQDDINMPDGLEKAFLQYINEAEPDDPNTPPTGEEEPPKEDPDKSDPKEETPEEKPEGEGDNPDAPTDKNAAAIKRLKKPKKTLSRIKYGNPTAEQLTKAIEGRNYVGMYYEEKTDHKLVLKGFRLIEPICYGVGYRIKRKDKKTGKYGYVVSNKDRQYLRAFVIRDTGMDSDTKKQFKTRRKSVSKTKKIPYFRMFRVDRIQSWFAFDFVFSKYRTLYNPKDECMFKVISSLDYNQFPRGEKASY
jgi:hypothetical protein